MSNEDNVYEGKPDERQSHDPATVPSRFRPRYRPLSPEEKTLHDAIKAKADELDALINEVGELHRANPSRAPAQVVATARYWSLARTSLEQAIMWAIKALTA